MTAQQLISLLARIDPSTKVGEAVLVESNENPGKTHRLTFNLKEGFCNLRSAPKQVKKTAVGEYIIPAPRGLGGLRLPKNFGRETAPESTQKGASVCVDAALENGPEEAP